MTRFDRIQQGVLFLIFGLAITVAYVSPAGAQDKVSPAATTAVNDAAKKGFPLTSSSTDVTGNISVEAVLIPAKIGKTVFGKEISKNYAIIALTISNRSSDESFIVHSVFVDYSEWLLSGASPFAQQKNAPCLAANTNPTTSPGSAQNAPAGQPPSGQGQANTNPTTSPGSPQKPAGQPPSGQGQANTNPTTSPESPQKPAEQPPSGQGQTQPYARCGNLLQTWQQQTFPNQIDSVETRIVRGELLDRQPWTTRNWVLRALQAAGSIATGFTFATSSQSWIRGIGAFNGSVIPAAQNMWPDATIGQMNRISDFGFQVNKVIAKQSSDIVVAFFPIERFLTPDLASLFISYPSIFFSPLAATADPKVSYRLEPYLREIFKDGETDEKKDGKKNERIDNLKKWLYQVVSGACSPDLTGKPAPKDSLEEACQTAELVDRLSLNVVRVRVGGSMTVDVNKVPPQISEVSIDIPAGKDATSMWAKGANLTGVIRGTFLGGGTPTVTNIDSKVLQVKAATEGSSDTELHFTITLSDNLPAGTNKLSFQVTKKPDGSTTTSATKDYTIDVNKVPPQITITEISIDTPAGKDAASMWAKGANLTGVIQGSFLGGGTPTVTNIDSKVLQVKAVTASSSDTELHFTITLNDNLPAGTNKLSFQVSKNSDGSTITSATHDYTIQIAPQAKAGPAATGGGTPSAAGSTQGTKPQAGGSTGPTGSASKPAKPPKK